MIKGIGIDICDTQKLKSKIRNNRKFLKRVFSAREIKYCKNKRNSILHLAGRFAAKEAFIKAISIVNGINLNKIEIANNRNGMPDIVLNKGIKALLRKKKGKKITISITHIDTVSAATCVIE